MLSTLHGESLSRAAPGTAARQWDAAKSWQPTDSRSPRYLPRTAHGRSSAHDRGGDRSPWSASRIELLLSRPEVKLARYSCCLPTRRSRPAPHAQRAPQPAPTVLLSPPPDRSFVAPVIYPPLPRTPRHPSKSRTSPSFRAHCCPGSRGSPAPCPANFSFYWYVEEGPSARSGGRPFLASPGRERFAAGSGAAVLVRSGRAPARANDPERTNYRTTRPGRPVAASVLGAAGQADRSKQVLSQAMSRRVLGHPDGQGAALVHLGLHHE